MKPNNNDARLLHCYFKKILGYGNNCKCGIQGIIKNTTNNSVEFRCKRCGLGWAFESDTAVNDMIKQVKTL